MLNTRTRKSDRRVVSPIFAVLSILAALLAFSQHPLIARQTDDPAAPQRGARLTDPPATGVVQGRALDINGQPVADGEAFLVEPRRRVSLTEEGKFRFEGLRPGEYLVEVRSEVHGTGVKRLRLGAGETAEIEITLDLATYADSVVVSAGADPRSRLEVAQPISVLSGEDLELAIQPTLGETLASQPGVGSTYFGPGASRPVIRGLGGDRVRVLEGGIGTLDVSNTSPDHAVGYDPLLASSIEVVRGPATLLYGSSAVGGVVNVLDERVPSAVPENPISGEVSLLVGTVADEQTGALHLEGGSGRWAWHVHGSRRDTDDSEIPGFAREDPEEGDPRGVLPNSALEREAAGLGVSRVGERSFFGVSVSGFDSLYGVPGGEHHEEAGGEPGDEHDEVPGGDGDEGIRIDLEQRRVDLQGEWFLRDGGFLRGVKTRLGLADYEHRELEGTEVGTRFLNDGFEGRLELVQRRRDFGADLSLSGSFGLQVAEADFEAVGEEAFVPPSRTDSRAVFAYEEIARGPVTFQLGGRIESQETDPEPEGLPSRSFTGLSSSLGLVWDFAPGVAVTAALARTERLPTANELYADGPHLATRTFELGDPDLEEEVSLGLDLSLRKKRGRLTGVLNLFVNRFDDYIFERFTGAVADGLDQVRFVQEDAEFRGAELEAMVELVSFAGGHLELLLGADVVEAELRRTGENLPRIPPLSWRTGLNVHHGRIRGTVELERVETQDDVAVNERPTDGYTLLDASLSYRLLSRGFVTDLHLRGRNLTDEEARNHVSFLKDEAPLPGRDLSLSLRFKF